MQDAGVSYQTDRYGRQREWITDNVAEVDPVSSSSFQHVVLLQRRRIGSSVCGHEGLAKGRLSRKIANASKLAQTKKSARLKALSSSMRRFMSRRRLAGKRTERKWAVLYVGGGGGVVRVVVCTRLTRNRCQQHSCRSRLRNEESDGRVKE